MIATDEETLLKEFLDEVVLCDITVDKEPHVAEIYIKFDCQHCDEVFVAPLCDPCYVESMGMFVRHRGIPCITCHEVCSLDAFVVIGPVR